MTPADLILALAAASGALFAATDGPGLASDAAIVLNGVKLFRSEGGSMWPAMPPGARMRVVPIADLRRPARPGEAIVFRHRDGILLKRVVGVGGDRIQMIDGALHRNGRPVPRSPLPSRTTTLPNGAVREAPCAEERLDGRRYEVCETEGDAGFYDRTGVHVVPADHVFVLGDDRDNSADSRDQTIGFVRNDRVFGVVKSIRRGRDVTIVGVDP